MLDIKQEKYLPPGFVVLGYILILTGIGPLYPLVAFFLGHFSFSPVLLAGPILILVGSIFSLTHYRVAIDPVTRTYNEYIWVLGVKSGKPVPFCFITRFFINQVKMSRGYHSYTGQRTTIINYEFKAFVKFDDGQKIHLDTDRSKQMLEKRIADYRLILEKVYHPE